MAGIPGSVVVPVLQGRRPLLVEVQALLGPEVPGGRPHTLGIDAARVVLLLAVLGCRTDVQVRKAEVFVAAVGGIAISEPAVDLAVALAVASAAEGRVVPSDLVVFGELGLAGEVRMVPGADRRLAEAMRAGFTRALIPASTPPDASRRVWRSTASVRCAAHSTSCGNPPQNPWQVRCPRGRPWQPAAERRAGADRARDDAARGT